MKEEKRKKTTPQKALKPEPQPDNSPDTPAGLVKFRGEDTKEVKAENQQKPDTQEKQCGFPIVGIGASAGGLEAFSDFFKSLPVDTGIAYVLVQHLDPTHTSSMVELLRRYTSMPVMEATNTVRIEPDHVYMIPPNKSMTISGCTLLLEDQKEHPGISHSIDMFFRSLAEDIKDWDIAIVLSGTGTDGTLGARVIKSNLGLVIAQSPDSARYDGMPVSVINAGLADVVLPADKMGKKLVEYVKQSFGQPAKKRHETVEMAANALQRIFAIIRARTKHDFSAYKPSTINRRIERRMSVNQIEDIEDYIRFLRDSPHEVEALGKDFLINVTSFFRDPEAFKILEAKIEEVVERKSKNGDHTFRVWVVGCSSGEEAYSIAIILRETMDKMQTYLNWQVFGTDLDPDAIETARHGIYPESVKEDISPERLKNNFTIKDGQFVVNRDIREKVVFSVHDVVTDPPFSRIDLISTRNLLIYLNSLVQKKVIPIFHYSLNNGGILFLGSAESIGEFTDYFNVVDRKWRIYQVQKKGERLPVEIPLNVFTPVTSSIAREGENRARTAEIQDVEKDLLRALPPSVLIDETGKVLYVHGDTWKFLQLAEGKLSSSIMDMAREGIRATLGNTINEALTRNETVSGEGAHARVNGYQLKVKITVNPISSTSRGQRRLAVVFEDVVEKRRKNKNGISVLSDARVKELEQDLQFTRENLRSTVEELETANEELRSANEEYQSTNEELQSTNEELETSREELQSVNEELVTVNSEHQKKIDELSSTNDDMQNLLNSTDIATIFLDNKLIIKRYTPATTKILNLIDGDIGRPLTHITSALEKADLVSLAQEVLVKLIPVFREVETKDGRWYSLRIHPYRTNENMIAGVVMAFVDINQQKQLEDEMRGLLETFEKPAVILNADLKIVSVNQVFFKAFHGAKQEIEGKSLYEVNKDLDVPQLKKLAESQDPAKPRIEAIVTESEPGESGRHKFKLNARVLNQRVGAERKILLLVEDLGAVKNSG